MVEKTLVGLKTQLGARHISLTVFLCKVAPQATLEQNCEKSEKSRVIIDLGEGSADRPTETYLKKINDTQDVKGIVGRATLPSVLESAGAKTQI